MAACAKPTRQSGPPPPEANHQSRSGLLGIAQKETPSEAWAKIQEKITRAGAFSVRVDGEWNGSPAKMRLACARPNKVYFEMQTTQERDPFLFQKDREPFFLMVSDGATLVSKVAGSRSEAKAETYLAASWTAKLVGGGIIPSMGYEAALGDTSTPPDQYPDFGKVLETKKFRYGKEEGSLKVIQYTALYTAMIKDEKVPLLEFEFSLTYDPRTYLPKERSLLQWGLADHKVQEQYSEWLFGDDVKPDLFMLPK